MRFNVYKRSADSNPNPFPKWRLFDCVFFPLKCSRNFVMVFLDPFSMSSLKPRQGPSPPSVEQILEDLSAAKDDDVVFKSPMQLGEHVSVCSTRDQTKGKTNTSVSHLDKTGNLKVLFLSFEQKGIVLGSLLMDFPSHKKKNPLVRSQKQVKGKVCIRAKRLIRPELIPNSLV